MSTLQLCLYPDSNPPSYTIMHINEQNIPDYCRTVPFPMKGTKIGIEVALATKGIVELIDTHKKLRIGDSANRKFIIAYMSTLFPKKFVHPYIDQYDIQLIKNII